MPEGVENFKQNNTEPESRPNAEPPANLPAENIPAKPEEKEIPSVATPQTPRQTRAVKEYLQREEIRTMAKDIAALQEAEAQKERERIAALKSDVATKESAPPTPVAPTPIPTAPVPPTSPPETSPGVFIPKPPPRKPSPGTKILIRLALTIGIALILFLLSFACWYFVVKKEKISGEEPAPSPQETTLPQELFIPPSLITVAETKTLEISTTFELADIFSAEIAKINAEKEQFTRIVIKNTTENKILGLKEFLQAFEAETPDGFYEKFENDFTLFVYSASNTDRMGFTAKIKEKEGLPELLTTWQKTMENDLDPLFTKGLGKNAPALVSYFKTASYKSVSFSYQTFAKADFGICYSVLNDYFIFTTSGKSILKTIDQLTQ